MMKFLKDAWFWIRPKTEREMVEEWLANSTDLVDLERRQKILISTWGAMVSSPFYLALGEGFEPSRHFSHAINSCACLPFPPPQIITFDDCLVLFVVRIFVLNAHYNLLGMKLLAQISSELHQFHHQLLA